MAIDFLHYEKSSVAYEYILVIMDHFTRYGQVYATRDKSAKTVAQKLYNDFILRFGFPLRIHRDQGGEFENRLHRELENLRGVEHSRTTPYHPQGNGQVERFNRTLVGMLRTLPETQKSRWAEHLNAYNCTRHESTGYSPFFLLFGRHPRLPIDLMFGIESQANLENHSRYVAKWRKAMTEAYELAGKKSSKVGTRAKQRYDRFARSSVLVPGDRVLVRNLSERGGPGKLRSHWEDKIHIVVSRKGEDSPVYEVKPEVGTGGNRILHRNLLLPCNNLPVDIPSKKIRKRERRAQKDECCKVPRIPASPVDDFLDGTSSDDEYTITPHYAHACEEVVTEEFSKPSVEERRVIPTHLEDDSSAQWKANKDNTVLEGREEDRPENGGEPDTPIQNDNSRPGSNGPEPRPQRQGHPPTLLTYNTLGNPTYETQAATHLITANSVLGRQLPQCCTAHLTWGAGLPAMPQFQLPTYPYLSPHPVIFGYPGTYLQNPSMPPQVAQPVNQYPVHQSVVYQPRNDLMQVPVTMTPGYVPVPSCVS